jgi:single-strand DNA-binding protein
MSPPSPEPPATPSDGGNIAVLRGEISTAPTVRELPAGGVVVNFDVATSAPGAGRGTGRVPVAWPDPPVSARRGVDVGTTVVVVGSVRRRFFRSGGVTQSRTEVVAAEVVRVRRGVAVRTLLESTAAAVDALAPPR